MGEEVLRQFRPKILVRKAQLTLLALARLAERIVFGIDLEILRRRHVLEEGMAVWTVLSHPDRQLALQVIARHVLEVGLLLVDAVAEEEEVVLRVLVAFSAERQQHAIVELRALDQRQIPDCQRRMLRHKVLAHDRKPAAADDPLQELVDAVHMPYLARAPYGKRPVFRDNCAGLGLKRTRIGRRDDCPRLLGAHFDGPPRRLGDDREVRPRRLP